MVDPLLSMPLRSANRVEFTDMVAAVVQIRAEIGIRPPFGMPDLEQDEVRSGLRVRSGVANQRRG